MFEVPLFNCSSVPCLPLLFFSNNCYAIVLFNLQLSLLQVAEMFKRSSFIAQQWWKGNHLLDGWVLILCYGNCYLCLWKEDRLFEIYELITVGDSKQPKQLIRHQPLHFETLWLYFTRFSKKWIIKFDFSTKFLHYFQVTSSSIRLSRYESKTTKIIGRYLALIIAGDGSGSWKFGTGPD